MDKPVLPQAGGPQGPDELEQRLDALGRAMRTSAEVSVGGGGGPPVMLAEIIRLHAEVRVLTRWTQALAGLVAVIVVLVCLFIFKPPPSQTPRDDDRSRNNNRAPELP